MSHQEFEVGTSQVPKIHPAVDAEWPPHRWWQKPAPIGPPRVRRWARVVFEFRRQWPQWRGHKQSTMIFSPRIAIAIPGANHEMDIATPKKKCRNVTSEFKNSVRNWTRVTRVPSFCELRRIGWVEVFPRYFEETLHDCSIASIRGTKPATPSSAGLPNASHHLPWFLVTVHQGVSPHFSGCLHSPLPSGKHTKSYWKWPSRNRWFTQL